MLTHVFKATRGTTPGWVQTLDTIVLIGAGGNGAAMLMRLYKMHSALIALGRPGLKVCVYDPDTVSTANLGRQPFYPADVGKNKAEVLIGRLKLVDHRLAKWSAVNEEFTEHTLDRSVSVLLVITCVDTKAARRAVHASLLHKPTAAYWLDMGNGASTGQIVLGECWNLNRKLRLPVVTELFPDILDESIQDDNTPSCSTAEALRKQDLMVNETVVAHAAGLLWQALDQGLVTHPVIFVNTKIHQVTSMGIDKDYYKRRGHTTGRATNPQIADM